jgi:hypothetical protein
MRTTVDLDDQLLAKVQVLTGTKEKPALFRQGLKALIERESPRRLGAARWQRARPAASTPPAVGDAVILADSTVWPIPSHQDRPA